MSLPNPYTPGQVPRVLAGREREQDRIKGHLSRVVAYGELGGPLLVFHAARGVGKTSLLRAAQKDAEAHGFVPVWVACSRGQPFLSELVNRVASSLERAEVIEPAEQPRWRTRLEKVGVEVGVPGLKLTAEVGRDAPTRPQPAAAPIGAIEDLLHDASTRVRTRGGAGLIVFLDELHAPRRVDIAVLLNAIQNLDGERERHPLAVIAAGLPSTPEVLTAAATFGERSSYVELRRLDDEQAAAAVTLPATELDVSWTPDAVSHINRQAQGYPYFLQLLAYAAWEAARPEAGGSIDFAAVFAGTPEADEQITAMYRARWHAASPLERELMTAVAVSGGEAVPRAAVAAAMGRTTQAISTPRDRLMDKGIIEAAGYGHISFTLPGFTEYVRRQSGASGPTGARSRL